MSDKSTEGLSKPSSETETEPSKPTKGYRLKRGLSLVFLAVAVGVVLFFWNRRQTVELTLVIRPPTKGSAMVSATVQIKDGEDVRATVHLTDTADPREPVISKVRLQKGAYTVSAVVERRDGTTRSIVRTIHLKSSSRLVLSLR